MSGGDDDHRARGAGSAIVAIVTLTVGLALLLPLLIDAIITVFDRAQRGSERVERDRGDRTALAEARVRSIAIAATGAIAVFGSVTIEGSRANLEGGIDRLVHQLLGGRRSVGAPR